MPIHLLNILKRMAWQLFQLYYLSKLYIMVYFIKLLLFKYIILFKLLTLTLNIQISRQNPSTFSTYIPLTIIRTYHQPIMHTIRYSMSNYSITKNFNFKIYFYRSISPNLIPPYFFLPFTGC